MHIIFNWRLHKEIPDKKRKKRPNSLAWMLNTSIMTFFSETKPRYHIRSGVNKDIKNYKYLCILENVSPGLSFRRKLTPIIYPALIFLYYKATAMQTGKLLIEDHLNVWIVSSKFCIPIVYSFVVIHPWSLYFFKKKSLYCLFLIYKQNFKVK